MSLTNVAAPNDLAQRARLATQFQTQQALLTNREEAWYVWSDISTPMTVSGHGFGDAVAKARKLRPHLKTRQVYGVRANSVSRQPAVHEQLSPIGLYQRMAA